MAIPQARAAASLEPSAKTRRPKTVRCSTNPVTAARASASQTPGAKSCQGWTGNVTARSFTQEAGASTVVCRASHLATPRATPSMPSVAMNGTTRRRVTTSPFTRPTRPPSGTAASTAIEGARPPRSSSAQRTPVRAIAEPTERSIPPPTITSVMPRAPIATITVCASTTRRLLPDR